MENIKISLSLDEIDMITCMLEGYQENMKDDDEDKKLVDGLVDKFYEFNEKVSSVSEYITGNDWPETAQSTLSISEQDIKDAK